jgi:hypothetical protein
MATSNVDSPCIKDKNNPPYDTINLFGIWCFPDFSSLSDQEQIFYNGVVGDLGLDDLFQYGRDIIDAWPLYLYSLGSILVLVFIWNMFLRCAGELLAWITIFAVGFGMGFLGYLIQTYGQKEYPEGDNTR